MKYTMKIAGLERSLPLCPLNDDVYIAAFVIFGDPELTTAAAKELLARAPEYDYIITAESKGIPLAHEMSRLAGNRKYFLARKAPKLYMDGVFEVTVRSITTSGEQKLYMDKSDAEMIKGKPIEEALRLSNKAVAEALDGLPPVKMHCSVLAEEAVRAAVKDYYDRHGIAYNPDEFCSGDCACCHAHDSGNGV